MKKICIITTMWSSINNWIKPFLNEYHQLGVDVTVVCNMDQEYEASLKEEFPFVHTRAIAFPRGMSVVGSIKSIFALRKFFKQNSFDMVQYSTPNASFYASLAAKARRIPVRLYCQWGMVYVTQHGIKRKIFKWMERTICKCSTNIQPDSIGNLEFCRHRVHLLAKKYRQIQFIQSDPQFPTGTVRILCQHQHSALVHHILSNQICCKL